MFEREKILRTMSYIDIEGTKSKIKCSISYHSERGWLNKSGSISEIFPKSVLNPEKNLLLSLLDITMVTRSSLEGIQCLRAIFKKGKIYKLIIMPQITGSPK